jgi:hypothetical protein
VPSSLYEFHATTPMSAKMEQQLSGISAELDYIETQILMASGKEKKEAWLKKQAEDLQQIIQSKLDSMEKTPKRRELIVRALQLQVYRSPPSYLPSPISPLPHLLLSSSLTLVRSFSRSLILC